MKIFIVTSSMCFWVQKQFRYTKIKFFPVFLLGILISYRDFQGSKETKYIPDDHLSNETNINAKVIKAFTRMFLDVGRQITKINKNVWNFAALESSLRRIKLLQKKTFLRDNVNIMCYINTFIAAPGAEYSSQDGMRPLVESMFMVKLTYLFFEV